jgi:hypothetical protein
MRCAMVGDLRVPVSASVGSKIREDLEIFLELCRGPTLGS